MLILLDFNTFPFLSHEDSKEVSTKETADQPSNLPESGEQNSTDAKLENCKTQDQVNCLPKGYRYISLFIFCLIVVFGKCYLFCELTFSNLLIEYL